MGLVGGSKQDIWFVNLLHESKRPPFDEAIAISSSNLFAQQIL